MEAISFGVPVLATNVGGVPEIVTAATGRLVDVQASPQTIADAASDLMEGNAPSRQEIVSFFEANFDAGTNFRHFAEMLDGV